MPALLEFVNAAHEMFRLHDLVGRGARNPYYMYVQVKLSTNVLTAPDADAEQVHVSPFHFLSGLGERRRNLIGAEITCSLPSVTLLVGEYGLGKTEFVFQFSDHLLQNFAEADVTPLPVNLAMLGWERSDLKAAFGQPPTRDAFCEVVFHPVMRALGWRGNNFFNDKLLPALHQGKLFLLFDGLDELIWDEGQHRWFFDGLRDVMNFDRSGLSRIRCMVTVRSEYLESRDSANAQALLSALRSDGAGETAPDVHFLHLDFLNDRWIESYLRRTNSEMAAHLPAFRGNERFFDLLRRPLFLQMMTALDNTDKEYKVSDLDHPVKVIEAFVQVSDDIVHLTADGPKSANTESPFVKEAVLLAREAGYTWDADGLAELALRMYETGSVDMSREDLSCALKPARTSAQARPPTPAEAILAIHKCPFLVGNSGNRITYSHRIFFEYFVCKAIVLTMKAGRPGDFYVEPDAFDRLVLNSDMRGFLRFLVERKYGKGAWFRRTFYSYALHSPEQWKLSDEVKFEALLPELEMVRCDLLESMTEPRTFPEDVARDRVRRFLKLSKLTLHPRYQMYNYEALTVFFMRHRRTAEDKKLRAEFEQHLKDRVRDLVLEVESPSVEDRDALDLLIERIAHVGRRLEIEELTERDLRPLVRDRHVKDRMTAAAIGKNVGAGIA